MADESKEREAGMIPEDSSRFSDAEKSPSPAPKADTEDEFLGFLGCHRHGIDSKGRMIIPASFREPLGQRFAMAPTPDFKAVAIYAIAGWKARRDQLLELVNYNPRAQRLLDQFSKYSYVDCEMDGQGRVLLPQKLRAWRLGDARDVDVSGCTSYIRIEPAVKSDEQDLSFDEDFADPLAAEAQMRMEMRGQF